MPDRSIPAPKSPLAAGGESKFGSGMMSEDDNNRTVRRDVRLLGATRGFQNGMFILPVLLPYYRDQIGLDFRDLLVGEAAFAMVVLVMEVPSGWLADVWGRKRTLVLGYYATAACFALLALADGFWLAVTAQAMIGIGFAMVSGADVALLYDRLAAAGRQGEFRRLEGARHGYGMYVLAGSSVVGGLLYQVAPLLPLLLTVAALAAAGLTCMFVSEPVSRRTALCRNPLMDILRATGTTFRGRPELICLYVFVAATFSVTLNGFWTQQPYYLHIGIPLAWFGVLAGVTQLLSGLAGSFGHWLDRHLSPGWILGGLLAGLSAAYLVSGLWPGLHGVGLLMFGAVAWGLAGPLVQDLINQRVGSERRATMLSFSSMAMRLTFVPLSLSVGWASERWDITVAICGLPALLLLVSLPALLTFRHLCRRRAEPKRKPTQKGPA